jgi:hypothetical protein
MSELMIKTVQTIDYLKYRFPDGKFDEERSAAAEQQVLKAFNDMYRNEGIQLLCHESQYLQFTIRTSNLEGKCRTEDLQKAYLYFIGICAGLGIVQGGL